jgi:hypothetical protein
MTAGFGARRSSARSYCRSTKPEGRRERMHMPSLGRAEWPGGEPLSPAELRGHVRTGGDAPLVRRSPQGRLMMSAA